jgi:hypothetical protein
MAGRKCTTADKVDGAGHRLDLVQAKSGKVKRHRLSAEDRELLARPRFWDPQGKASADVASKAVSSPSVRRSDVNRVTVPAEDLEPELETQDTGNRGKAGRHDWGRETAMTLEEYRALNPQELRARARAEFADVGGLRAGKVGSDWIAEAGTGEGEALPAN